LLWPDDPLQDPQIEILNPGSWSLTNQNQTRFKTTTRPSAQKHYNITGPWILKSKITSGFRMNAEWSRFFGQYSIKQLIRIRFENTNQLGKPRDKPKFSSVPETFKSIGSPQYPGHSAVFWLCSESVPRRLDREKKQINFNEELNELSFPLKTILS